MKITSFQKKLRKAGRIVSEREKRISDAAKKDVGSLNFVRFSQIATKSVPKALHHMYGLPMRNRMRSLKEQKTYTGK